MKIKENERGKKNENEVIWNSSYIKTDNKTVYKKNWVDKGIIYLIHFFDYRKKEYYNFVDMKIIYNIPESDFLKYNSLQHNIPTDLKTKLSKTNIYNESNTNILEKLKIIKANK